MSDRYTRSFKLAVLGLAMGGFVVGLGGSNNELL